MKQKFSRFFSAPVFVKDEDNFRARFINSFVWVLIFLLSIAIIPQIIKATPDYTFVVLLVLLGIMFLSLYLLRKRYLNLSGIMITVLTWLSITFQAATAEGVKDVIIVAYIAVGLLASIVISWQSGSIFILASIGAIWGLSYLETNQLIVPGYQPPSGYARDLTIIFIAITTLIYFSTTSLRDAITRANKSEAGLLKSNKELQELNLNLEERVSSRTAELELINQRNEKRARQFEAIAQVARATTANENLETLLPRLTTVISQQFDFYHVGIFLLDENRENAVLRAANSEGGERMLQRKHRLPIGQTSIVGFVSATGNPRIALDVGADSVFFNNPDLPDTHSELALPLRIAGEIIGVLDVQSTISNAFQNEDIEVLSTLADQVAVAIQNARSFETTQDLLKEAQKVSGTYIQESWRILQEDEVSTGYRVDADEISHLHKPLSSEEVKQAIANKRTVIENGKKATLAVPIRLRDEVIGVMDIRALSEHEWDDDEVDIAQAVAERLSLALESALLLKSTQRQAELERITADISGKIGSTTQFDSILRTAAEELSRVLGGSEVLVQIQPELPGTSIEEKQA